MTEKELGMVWYKILRYFSFGFGRFLMLFLCFLWLCLIVIEFSFLNVYYFLIVAAETLFFFVMHRHLENYSDKIHTMIKVQLAVSIISCLLNIGQTGSLPTLVYGIILFFINRKYFKNRSHLFTNECNIWGKKIK